MSEPYYSDESVTLLTGPALDVLRTLPDASVNCCVTSPPYYGLRAYGDDPAEQGREESPAEYVAGMVAVFREVRRVLADDGTLWLNLGDSYASDSKWGGATGGKHAVGLHGDKSVGRRRRTTGLPNKSLIGIPWRVALALQDDGWILRNDNIWHKRSGMPEAVTDRLSMKHEYVFMLSKSRQYHFNLDAIRVPAVTTRPDALSWDRDEQAVPGQRPQHRPGRGAGKADGTNMRPSGARHSIPIAGRPQRARAEQIAREKGLTQSHIDAIRACGVTDTGKATATQTGAGKNDREAQRLAAEAKIALGGYYREFLTPPGKNPGTVWTIPTQPFPEAHYAVMAPAVATICVAAGCKSGGTVLDPYSGVGTTGMVAGQQGKRYVGIDLYQHNHELALRTRLAQSAIVTGDEAS